MSIGAQIRQMNKEAEEAARAEAAKDDLPMVQKPPVGPLMNPDGTPTPEGWRKIGERFRQPIPHKERQGRGGMKFSYINARQVQERLDGVVGPGNWQTTVQVIRADHPVSVQVSLGVFNVWKTDVGYSNNPEADDENDRSYELEPLKAAVSDGFKRAAVQFGIGRFLYDR